MATIFVSKIAAARRQLDCAIELWTNDGDAVSVHTLASAAHEIIYALNKKHGKEPMLFDSPAVADEIRGKFVATVRMYQNFFKHADRDATEKIELDVRVSEYLILYCILGLKLICEEPSRVHAGFLLWVELTHNRLLIPKTMKSLGEAVQSEKLELLRKMPKAQFMRLYH